MVNSLALAGVAMGCCSTDSVEEVTRAIIITIHIIINIMIVLGLVF